MSKLQEMINKLNDEVKYNALLSQITAYATAMLYKEVSSDDTLYDIYQYALSVSEMYSTVELDEILEDDDLCSDVLYKRVLEVIKNSPSLYVD